MKTVRRVSGAGLAGVLWILNLPASVSAVDPPLSPLTVEVQTTVSFTRAIAPATEAWRYFKGTSNPNLGWDTADEEFLGPAWLSGTPGFGYGEGDDRTVLNDMANSYSTVYARYPFKAEGMLDPKRLHLRVNYDDGFIAFLNGHEIVRAHAPGAPGQFAPFDAVATAAHEAGLGAASAELFDLPAAMLPVHRGVPPRSNVLAIQGLNRAVADNDFTLKAELLLDNYFVEVPGDAAELTGTVNVPGATRLTVNDETAQYQPGQTTWRKTQPLTPGMNRLEIRAWNSQGDVVAHLTRDVVSQQRSVQVSESISHDTTWDNSGGVIKVISEINIPAGVKLTIAPGTTLLLQRGAGFNVTGGALALNGTADLPIYLLPANGYTPWKQIRLTDSGAELILKHAEIVAGRIHLFNYVNALIEDSVLRDSSTDDGGLEQQIIYTLGYVNLTLRRTRISRYFEMALGGQTKLTMEDCIVEFAEDDAIKVDDGALGTVIRNSIIGPSSPGDDAVDFGARANGAVENCVIHDIFDRGISIGEEANVKVNNCLIYNVANGVGVKDSSLGILNHLTIANSGIGVVVYEKFKGAGHARATLTNSIVWNNQTNITLRHPETGAESDSTIDVGYCLVGGDSVFAGQANVNADPEFVNPSVGNFQLLPGSPARATGLGGVDRGVIFPVGPPGSFEVMPQLNGFRSGAPRSLRLRLIGRAGRQFAFQSSSNLVHWQTLSTNAAPDGIVTIDQEITGPSRFFRFFLLP